MASINENTAKIVSAEFLDLNGVPSNATVTLTVWGPLGAETTPPINNPVVGTYTAEILYNQAGIWSWVWEATGAVNETQYGQQHVVGYRTLVASMAELKEQLNMKSSMHNAELRTYLETATDFVEWSIGSLGLVTYSHRVRGTNRAVVPPKQPLVEVISLRRVCEEYGSPGPEIPEGGGGWPFYLRPDPGGVIFLHGQDFDSFGGRSYYDITYTAGITDFPGSAHLAGLLIADHLWRAQNGGGGLPEVFMNDGVSTHPLAIPPKAAYLLRSLRSTLSIPGIA